MAALEKQGTYIFVNVYIVLYICFMKVTGIYKITNTVNNKIYIGYSKNISRRFTQHRYWFKQFISTGFNSSRISPHLFNAVAKYGIDKFTYNIVEVTEISELKVREAYWIQILSSFDAKYGYNVQTSDNSEYSIRDSTRKKISARLTKEWSNGVRHQHSGKLKDWWSNNDSQRQVKSELLTKTLTKYEYYIYKDDNLIATCNYQELVDLGLKNSVVSFWKTGKDTVNCKKHKVVRVKI